MKLGARVPGYAQVLEGLKPGERVVTSATFLIDAESNLARSARRLYCGRRQVIAAVIRWSARNILLILVCTVAVVAGGFYSVGRISLDAIPDLSDAQVIVYTEMPGQAPQVVEDQVTYPLTTAMLAVPRSRAVRGFSFFGVSFVYVIFEDGTDIYWARSRVLEYLEFRHREAAGRRHAGARTRRHRRRLGLPVRRRRREPRRWPSCARCRTGTCALASPRRKASPRWRASAASCGNTRSWSTR